MSIANNFRLRDLAPLVMATDNVENAITGALAQKTAREWEFCFHENTSNKADSVKSLSGFYLSDSVKSDLRKKDTVGYVYLLSSKNFTNGPDLWATSEKLEVPVAKVAVTSADVEHLLSRIKPRNQELLHQASECMGSSPAVVDHVSKLPRPVLSLESKSASAGQTLASPTVGSLTMDIGSLSV